MSDPGKFRHSTIASPYVCIGTGQAVDFVFTDHERPGVFNACRHCHEDKTSIGQRLSALNARRAETSDQTIGETK